MALDKGLNLPISFISSPRLPSTMEVDLTQRVKNQIEVLHLENLCGTLNLQLYHPGLPYNFTGFFPDLIGIEPDGRPSRTLFELKTRAQPEGREPSRYWWYELTRPQIKGYERVAQQHNLAWFWILVHCTIPFPATEIIEKEGEIREEHILWREIYFAPREIYLLACHPENERMHISKKKLKERYSFETSAVKKGELFVAEVCQEQLWHYLK
jgi:hypothetical protein